MAELRKQINFEIFAKSRSRIAKVLSVARNLVPDTWTADREGALPELSLHSQSSRQQMPWL